MMAAAKPGKKAASPYPAPQQSPNSAPTPQPQSHAAASEFETPPKAPRPRFWRAEAFFRGALVVGGGLIAASLAVLALAQTALWDEADELRGPQDAVTLRAALGKDAAFADAAGLVRIEGTPLRGHGAPVLAAFPVGGGAQVLTSDAAGSVRLSQARVAMGQDAPESAMAWAKDAIWAPLGAPVARASLSAARLLGMAPFPFREPEMVTIPAGSFTMGSSASEANRMSDEAPQHPVSIRSFAAGKYEVTFDEWMACATAGACSSYIPSDLGWSKGSRPVINVSWENARQYVQWLSARTGKTYRLLTEAEWEYAARAGTTSAYSWGASIGSGNANCNGCGSQWDSSETAPVGSFRPNAFGLYDMHGNVWEWVEDCYTDSYAGAPSDGSSWTSGDCSSRVLRGGSWSNSPQYLRSAVRFRYAPANRSLNLGFRVARTL